MNTWNQKKISQSSFPRVAWEIEFTSQSKFYKSCTCEVRDKQYFSRLVLLSETMYKKQLNTEFLTSVSV